MNNLFVISSKDIQYLAEKKIGRKLTVEELELVKKGLEFGLEYWEEVVNTTIDEVINNKIKNHKNSKTKYQ